MAGKVQDTRLASSETNNLQTSALNQDEGAQFVCLARESKLCIK